MEDISNYTTDQMIDEGIKMLNELRGRPRAGFMLNTTHGETDHTTRLFHGPRMFAIGILESLKRKYGTESDPTDLVRKLAELMEAPRKPSFFKRIFGK